MRFAVVVVTWNGTEWIDGCLGSILGQEGDQGIIVVDNGSSDDTVERAQRLLRDAKHSQILCLGRNYGFPSGANRGMEAALSADPAVEGILLLNQDARLEKGAMTAFAQFLKSKPQAGALGAKILYPDRQHIQHAGGFLDRPRMVGLHLGHHESADDASFNEPREVDYVTGAAMMIRSECLRDFGLFEELFSPGYYEDVELCERLTRNKRPVFYVPDAKAVHEESSSFSNRDQRLRLSNRNRLIFALSHIFEAPAAGQFLEAEVEYLTSRAHRDEVRGISSAALEVLSIFPAAIRSRIGGGTVSEENVDTARRILISIRSTCREILISNLTRGGKDDL